MEFCESVEHFRRTVNGPWEKADRTDYRLQIDHENKAVHVTGRGSCDEDWPDNFDFRAREPAERWFPGSNDILVHAGFLRQYKAVRDTLLDAAYAHPDYIIRVDGYSLGASWTQIFAQDALHRWPGRDIKGIFYAPGNPWRRLPVCYQVALKNSVKFVYCRWDPVTWMRALRFFRYGKNTIIGNFWRAVPFQHLKDQILQALFERKMFEP